MSVGQKPGARGTMSPVQLDPAATPEAIEARSFAIIEAEAPVPRPFSGHAWTVARRIVHAAGDLSLLPDLVLPDAAIAAGLHALASGASIFTDTEMVRSGMPQRRLLPLGCSVECALEQPGLAEEAARLHSTRVRAGFSLLGDRLGASIVVVGNAPTALLAILEYLENGGTPPALVIGMPVGFVNAAESKELLLQCPQIHSLVLRGRRGGSPLAAATLNALAALAVR